MAINREKVKTGTKWAAGVGGWATAAVLALKMGLSGPAPLPPEQVAQQLQQRPVAVRVLSADEAANTLTLKFPGPEELDRVKEGAPITFETTGAAGGASPVPEPVAAPIEPAPKVEEPAPKVEEPAPKVEEPAPKVEEPAPKEALTVLDKVEGMVTDASGALTGFPNVKNAIGEMEAALKTNPDLQKDAKFWVKLGGLYGLTGCDFWGDVDCTPEEYKKRIDGLACLNKALEIDPTIANTTVWGQPFNGWYAGIRDTAVGRGGFRGDTGKLTVTVEADGSIKVGEK